MSRAEGSLWVASAVLGGFGALARTPKGLIFFNGPFLVGVLGYWEFHRYHALWMGLEGGTVLFSLVDIVSVGFALAGRHRAGAWTMVISGAGVAASVATFVLVCPSLLKVLYETRGYPLSLRAYVLRLFPVLPLLIGAVLSFLALRKEG